MASFSRSRDLFLRLLALVYLIAYASLAVQITGLIGDRGLLPAGEFLERARAVYAANAYRFFPTVAWLSHSDAFLTVLCWTGMAASALLLVGIAPVAATALLWALYLSLTVAGQEFLQFQWDALLLETGLLAILYSPLVWRLRRTDPEPPAIVRWALWGLAFKVTFLSGVTKIASGDATWANLTALTYHYETQPLPAPTSWFAHQLPAAVHVWSAAAMFGIEIAVPWLVFAPPRFRHARHAACAVMIALQVGIAATGNYGFFNLLTIVLYVAMLEDRTIDGLLWRSRSIFLKVRRHAASGTLHPPINETLAGASPVRWRFAANIVGVGIAVLSVMAFWREIDLTLGRGTPLSYLWSPRLLDAAAPLNSINGYGLFRVMTTERPEIVIEVSEDGATWKEYPFRWKPGDVARRPAFVEPHMPRLDWQMWFAALGPESAQQWLMRLIDRLLAGDRTVTRLLGNNPLPHPPRYARLAYYRYRFATPRERSQTGAWWHREFVTYLTDPITAQVR